jgi:hypothetical protein
MQLNATVLNKQGILKREVSLYCWPPVRLVWISLLKTKIVSCYTADSKPVQQEVNSTVILPPLVFPGLGLSYCVMEFWTSSLMVSCWHVFNFSKAALHFPTSTLLSSIEHGDSDVRNDPFSDAGDPRIISSRSRKSWWQCFKTFFFRHWRCGKYTRPVFVLGE